MAEHGGPPVKLDGKIEELKRALFMREADEAALLYRDILAYRPDFLLPGPVQYDLACVLERAGHEEIAFEAYRLLLELQPDNKSRNPALRSAGHLAFKLKKYPLCKKFLTEFRKSEPLDSELAEAEDVLRRLPPKTRIGDGSDESRSSIHLDDYEPDPETPAKRRRAPRKPRARIPPPPPPPPEEEEDYGNFLPASQPPTERLPHGHQPPAPPAPEAPPGYFLPPGYYPAPVFPYPQTPATPAAYGPRPQDPSPPRAQPSQAGQGETPEQLYSRLRGEPFALLLPRGKRIHLDEVAAFLDRVEGIGPAEGKKQVLRRKGLLRDGLSLAEVLKLQKEVERCQQSMVFVHTPSALRPPRPLEVLSAQMHERGLKMGTERTREKIRWGQIRLINCGVLEDDLMVSLLGGDPMSEYRFIDQVFDLEDFSPTGMKSLREGLYEFLDFISTYAVNAERSHTVDAILRGAADRPQPFGDEEEYNSYNKWMIFSRQGVEIDAGMLAELSKMSSDW